MITRKGFTLTFLDDNESTVEEIVLDEDSNRARDGAGYFYPPQGTYARYVRISRSDGRIDLAEVEVMGWEVQNFRSRLLLLANQTFKSWAASNIDNAFLRNCIAANVETTIFESCNPFLSSPIVYALVTGDSFELDVTSPIWDDSSKGFVIKYEYKGRENEEWVVIREGTIPLNVVILPAMIQTAIVGSLESQIESATKDQVEECYKSECVLDTKVSSACIFAHFPILESARPILKLIHRQSNRLNSPFCALI